MGNDRNTVKLVNMLLDALAELRKARLRHIQGRLEEFRIRCSELVGKSRLFHAAVDKNWFRSAGTVRTRLSRDLNDFSYHLQQLKISAGDDEVKLPKPAVILADIRQIEDEFGQLSYDLGRRTLSVTTERVTLEEIPLGPFEIRLAIDRISRVYVDAPYRVIALEPNPAGADDAVTHPHVSSEKLCEGDGYVAIRKAIEQGRFCDFYTMVVNILQTYNPDSPYVSLSEWEGVSCYDCGYTVSSDDTYYCQDCDRDYCSQCSTYCRACDETICLSCSVECSVCDISICRNCSVVCSECGQPLCKDCMTEEGLCTECQDNRKEHENDEESAGPETVPAVQPEVVGQAAVHA